MTVVAMLGAGYLQMNSALARRQAEAVVSLVEGTEPAASVLGVTTGAGARLGSNGDVRFLIPADESAEVWGDVMPGPGGLVSGLENVTVAGSLTSRGSTVELPAVDVPNVSRVAALRHEDLLPMLISSGTSGYDRIEVAPGAELVIRGPATVAIDSLVLEPSALLTLDTRAGEVALFITDRVDLQPGSIVATSGIEPSDTTVQVSAALLDPLAPSVNLEATSQFRGTIYAPETNVHIGSEFEIFGGVVARRLDVSSGARLHFDGSGSTGSALPRIIGWRAVEAPPAIRALRGDPLVAPGLDASSLLQLSEAHDLGSLQMDLTYLDVVGIQQTYSGPENLFDWTQASAVVSVERNATRPREDGSIDPISADPTTAEPSVAVEQAISDLTGPALKTELLANAPLTADGTILLMDSQKLGRTDTMEVLVASEPLADQTFEAILSGRWVLSRSEACELLINGSPLSPAMLDMVVANTGGLLGNAEIQAIREANL